MILFSKLCKSFSPAARLLSLRYLNQAIANKEGRLYSTEVELLSKKTLRSMRRKKTSRLDGLSWFLLVIPIASFGLGTWQIQRKFWKESLIKDLEERTTLPPVNFPDNLEDLEHMEYMPVKVKGKFDHSKEILMGPRPVISDLSKTSAYSSSLLSSKNAGFLIITPFTLSDRGLTVLVNRGWVPAQKKNPKARQESLTTEEVELVGLVRHSEKRQPLGMRNVPEKGLWMYRDVEKMSQITGAAPIFLDSLNSSLPDGIKAGQTIVGLRNDHVTYILTWYLLMACTGYLWWARYIKGP